MQIRSTPPRFGAVHLFSKQESRRIDQALEQANQNNRTPSMVPPGEHHPMLLGYIAAKTGELSILNGSTPFEIIDLFNDQTLVLTNTETPDFDDYHKATKSIARTWSDGVANNLGYKFDIAADALICKSYSEGRLHAIG